MLIEYALVFVIAMLAGGWAIPVGILFKLDPGAVYATASVGSLTVATAVLVVGGRSRDLLFDRLFPGVDDKIAASKASTLLEKYGVVGFATLGQLIIGPTIGLAAAVTFGVDRRRFALWYAFGTLIGFAVLTLFWDLVLN